MEARWALAFVSRREGVTRMEASRWRHVLSLELGWMAPGQAAAYVEACHKTGLLAADGDALRLTFDPKGVKIPRGFRPDPSDLPTATHEPEPTSGFGDWLARIAAARGEDVGATMAAVEALQMETAGMLHAEAALLLVGARAGLDVRAAAREALTRLA